MAKIDVTTIPGYDKMSDAEKIAALIGAEIPDPDMSAYVSKTTFDKTASELATMKKAQRDALSEAERKEAEKNDKIADLEKRLAEITAREQITNYTSKYRGLGYDEKLALETAQALAKGDMDKVFANHSAFLTAHDKAYKAELMSGATPPPAGGKGSGTMTLNAFRKLSTEERLKYSQDYPDEYKQMYEGGTT